MVTSGRVVESGGRTRTPSVRKLIIKTPVKKTERGKDRKKERKSSGQCWNRFLAAPVKAELAARRVLLSTDVSLVDGVTPLPSN